MSKTLKLKNFFFFQGSDLSQAIAEAKREDKDTTQLEMVHTESLQNWLIKQKLHGEASRARTRFSILINERVLELDKERVKLAEDNCKKKDGKIVFLDEKEKETTDEKKGKKYAMDTKQKEKFDKEHDEYLNSELVLDITPATSECIYGVRDLLLNTQEEFSGLMAIRYSEWCDCFEAIK